MVGLRYLWTGIGWDTGQREAVLRSRLRPKLPATADQRAVTREPAGCRNRLLIGYSTREIELAAETLFCVAGYRFAGYFG